MARIEDRDPAICEEKIQKRRELLIQLHEENLYELQHPALVEVEEENGECQDEKCLLKAEKINPEEYKKKLIIKILSVVLAGSIIVVLILIALLIGNLGK
ncbi:hypothetical protein [Mycoplasmopsis iners]|uniref:hypothetical protein n=1 Tax=Mycoplasmopsis iners TaxID=76630 RepID=UPI0004960E75|nr:hypothetical protein [Mycoplasmopsis iners]